MLAEEFSDRFEDGDVNCEVSWKISYANISEDHYDYALLYYSGVRSFDRVRDGGIDVCALVFCQNLNETNGDYSNCGNRYIFLPFRLYASLSHFCAGIPRTTRSNGRI